MRERTRKYYEYGKAGLPSELLGMLLRLRRLLLLLLRLLLS